MNACFQRLLFTLPSCFFTLTCSMPATYRLPALRKRHLIQATLVIVHEYGVAGATIAKIARTAGVSVGLIAHHFGSRDALLHATLRHVLKDLALDVRRCRRLSPQEPRYQLHAVIDAFFASSGSCRVRLEFAAASRHEQVLSRVFHVHHRRAYSTLRHLFAMALSAEQAQHAARGLGLMLQGACMQECGSAQCLTGHRQSKAHAYAYVDCWLFR